MEQFQAQMPHRLNAVRWFRGPVAVTVTDRTLSLHGWRPAWLGKHRQEIPLDAIGGVQRRETLLQFSHLLKQQVLTTTLELPDADAASRLQALLGHHENAEVSRSQQATDAFHNEFVSRPPARAVPALVAANVLMFLFAAVMGAGIIIPDAEVMIRLGANFGVYTSAGEWWRLLSSAFLHFGLIHLAMNMWALWESGRFVERLMGTSAFTLLYLVGAVVASTASLVWYQGQVVSAGASGAVFAVFGALAVYLLQAKNRIPLAVLQPMLTSTAFCIGYSLLNGLSKQGIDNAAHLGGLAFGALFALIYPATKLLASASARVQPTQWVLALATVVGVAVIAPRFGAATEAAKSEHGFTLSLQAFAAEEERINRDYNAIIADLQAGKLTELAAGNAIQQCCQQQWIAASRPILALNLDREAPSYQRAVLLQEYVVLRTDIFELLIYGMRTGDQAVMPTLTEKTKRVSAILAELKRQ